MNAEVRCGVRFRVLNRDGFACQYCGRKPPDVVLHVDHIIPKANGGRNNLENLVTSCGECNLGKGVNEIVEVGPVDAQKMAERMEQARDAHRKILERETAIDTLEKCWIEFAGDTCDESEEHPELYVPFGFRDSMARILKHLPVEALVRAMGITFVHLQSQGEYQQLRYFCAICWRTIKGEVLEGTVNIITGEKYVRQAVPTDS